MATPEAQRLLPQNGNMLRADGTVGNLLDTVEDIEGGSASYVVTELEVGGGGCVGMCQMSHLGQSCPPTPLAGRKKVTIKNIGATDVIITMVDQYQHGYTLEQDAKIEFDIGPAGMNIFAACMTAAITINIIEEA